MAKVKDSDGNGKESVGKAKEFSGKATESRGKVEAPNDRFSLKAPHKAAQGLHRALHKALISPDHFLRKTVGQ
jgi:hypothetical protein